MTTKVSIAKEVMRNAKELAFSGLIVIDRSDLEGLIRDAVERGIELGRELGLEQGRKFLDSKSRLYRTEDFLPPEDL